MDSYSFLLEPSHTSTHDLETQLSKHAFVDSCRRPLPKSNVELYHSKDSELDILDAMTNSIGEFIRRRS